MADLPIYNFLEEVEESNKHDDGTDSCNVGGGGDDFLEYGGNPVPSPSPLMTTAVMAPPPLQVNTVVSMPTFPDATEFLNCDEAPADENENIHVTSTNHHHFSRPPSPGHNRAGAGGAGGGHNNHYARHVHTAAIPPPPPPRPPHTSGLDEELVDDCFLPTERLMPTREATYNEDTRFIPYKYIIDGKKLIICTRSTDGSKSKLFSHRINNWSYINIPHGMSNIPKSIQYLRSILATEKVSFDKTTLTFVVEPSDAVNEKVESVSLKPITRVPLTSSTILARLDKKFFDPFVATGEISPAPLEKPLTVNKNARYSNLFGDGNVNFAAFKTMVWTTVDDSTIVFVYYNSSHDSYYKFSHSKVVIWTTLENFTEKESIEGASNSIRDKAMGIYKEMHNNGESSFARDPETLPDKHFEIDITVKCHDKVSTMMNEFMSLIDEHTDICVHYGEKVETSNLLGNRIIKTYESKMSKKGSSDSGINKVEFIDLKHYTSKIYSYLPSHEIYDIIKQVDLSEDNTDIRAYACLKSILDGSQFIGWQLPITSEVSTTENISFFIEKITAKCFLISKLYIMMSKNIFNICHMSGCNPSDIVKPGCAARGIVSFVNQIASCAQIVDKLPGDYMPPGFRGLTNVIPLSDILIDKMVTSPHDLTRDVGQLATPIKEHGWIIRDLYSLRSLKPLKVVETPQNMPGIFGYFNDMVYTTEGIPNFSPVCQWSSIINVGLGWVGITVPLSGSSSSSAGQTEDRDGQDLDIVFGYFGIDDVCNHPFQALKNSVEMYLTLFISSSTSGHASIPNPHMIARAIPLTDTNMKIRQNITSYNIDSYRNLILPKIAKEIEEGKMEIYIDLWHCKEDNLLTTNQHKADKSAYRKIITETLTRSFDCILREVIDEQVRESSANNNGGGYYPTAVPFTPAPSPGRQCSNIRNISSNHPPPPPPTLARFGGPKKASEEESRNRLHQTSTATNNPDNNSAGGVKSPSCSSEVNGGGGCSLAPPSTPIVEISLGGRDNIFK